MYKINTILKRTMDKTYDKIYIVLYNIVYLYSYLQIKLSFVPQLVPANLRHTMDKLKSKYSYYTNCDNNNNMSNIQYVAKDNYDIIKIQNIDNNIDKNVGIAYLFSDISIQNDYEYVLINNCEIINDNIQYDCLFIHKNSRKLLMKMSDISSNMNLFMLIEVIIEDTPIKLYLNYKVNGIMYNYCTKNMVLNKDTILYLLYKYHSEKLKPFTKYEIMNYKLHIIDNNVESVTINNDDSIELCKNEYVIHYASSKNILNE